ncbi:MAG: hypothetical protein AAFQ65_10540 [Myxococcota bacterium]
MRMRWMGCAVLLVMGCDGSDDASDVLQSECVAENINIDRVIPDGGECRNFGFSDCGADEFASDCVGVCAFDVCQSNECTSDSDCDDTGFRFECQDFELPNTGVLGRYCGESDCPRGTTGCPCLAGDQCDGNATCENDVCVFEDDCPSGCRVGSVCCGGALCAGNCIGTPCC